MHAFLLRALAGSALVGAIAIASAGTAAEFRRHRRE
jgi:hypothetical protein